MGKKRGPRPEPTALKRAKGNPGRRALPEDEPAPKVRMPAMPRWLSPKAKTVWRNFGPRLVELQILTELDGLAFGMACQTVSDWQDAWRAATRKPSTRKTKTGKKRVTRAAGRTATTPNGYDQVSAQHCVERQLRKDAFDMLSAFGMTPSGRSGLKVTLTNGTSKLQEFLRAMQGGRRGGGKKGNGD